MSAETFRLFRLTFCSFCIVKILPASGWCNWNLSLIFFKIVHALKSHFGGFSSPLFNSCYKKSWKTITSLPRWNHFQPQIIPLNSHYAVWFLFSVRFNKSLKVLVRYTSHTAAASHPGTSWDFRQPSLVTLCVSPFTWSVVRTAESSKKHLGTRQNEQYITLTLLNSLSLCV